MMILNSKPDMDEIENEFFRQFPFMKLELEPIDGMEENSNLGVLEISGNITLADLNRLLQDQFFLMARIKRRSHEGYIDISDEDHLNLEEENELGRTATSGSETHFEDFLETEY